VCAQTFNLWVTAETILCRHQQRFSINVCAGIIGDCLIGPHVLPHQLTGSHYPDFLSHDVPKLPEGVPLAVRARMWYMHDGALAHCSRDVRDVLNIMTDGQRRSHCMASTVTRLESSVFLPVGTPKHPCVCSSCWHFTIALWMPVRLAATTPASLDGCSGPWWDVLRHALNLMEGILSIYYKCTLSAITHKLNVSGRLLIWTCFLVLVCGTLAQSFSPPSSCNLYKNI
jgi:hypothetical protein